jgi:xanthine dehydrogenase YagR molybdenum-binding subunit
MSELLAAHAIGSPVPRVDGPVKVTGTAPYAYEVPVDDPAYAFAVQSTVANGRITAIDTAEAQAQPGVLAVLTHENAPRLADTGDKELAVLQGPDVGFVGQFVAVVVADSSETARQAASLVRVEYDARPADVEISPGRDDLYAPDAVNPSMPADTAEGDVDAALRDADVVVDQVYSTPNEHNNPMEPHACTAVWRDGTLTMHDSSQGVHTVRSTLAPIFGLDEDKLRVVSPYVGGGFGSKGMPHAHNVLVGLAAQAVAGRPVRFALTRQQMFSVAGHRTPTIQHVRLGAGRDGRLVAIANDVVEHTAKVKEFAEQTGVPTRMMYAAPNRRTTHRLAALDVPIPSWMRGPGETPGMFAPEVALDELAEACGVDPIELRIRNEPDVDPETGNPWSSRHLVECLREGARRFGWAHRPAAPRSRLEDGWWVGTGVASAVYPLYRRPGSSARIVAEDDGHYLIQIGAADIGTGSWTALTQIAADALRVPVHCVRVEIADTALPMATVAGGSSGTTSWGSTVVAAARALREKYGDEPPSGAECVTDTPENEGRRARDVLLRRAFRRGARARRDR